MKNHFLLRVFITHYLLHSLKCTFCKNLDKKEMEKASSNNIQQNSSPMSLLAVLRLLRTYWIAITISIREKETAREKRHLEKRRRRNRRFVDSIAQYRSRVESECCSRAANRFSSCNSAGHSACARACTRV